MTTPDDPSQRADAIFDALNVSETEEQAKEAAEIEDKVQRMETIRDRVANDEK